MKDIINSPHFSQNRTKYQSISEAVHNSYQLHHEGCYNYTY